MVADASGDGPGACGVRRSDFVVVRLPFDKQRRAVTVGAYRRRPDARRGGDSRDRRGRLAPEVVPLSTL